MNLFAGLEKFGLKAESNNIFAEEKQNAEVKKEEVGKEKEIPSEDTFLLDKTVHCTVCGRTFKVKAVKSGRMRRLEPDMDLRPNYEGIDVLKYDVASCPYCGYTALHRYFEHLSAGQVKLIRDQVCSKFKPSAAEEPKVMDYDTAIERYKLALFNTVVKKGKNSEKAYTCLKLSWLYRAKGELLDGTDPEQKKEKEACKEQEEAFYAEAYDGFMKCISTEMFPICGMDQCTMDYLLAVMSWHFKKYDVASKCIANIQFSQSASKKMKDKVYDLKEKVMAEIRSGKQQA